MVKIILSLITLVVGSFLLSVVGTTQSIFSADLAGVQFLNSNAAAVMNTAGQSLFNIFAPFIGLSMFGILFGIWYPTLKKLFKPETLAAILLTFAVGCMYNTKAEAFYQKNDAPEVYMIMPNESAFWVPDQGANKDSQTKFESEDYYNSNKIAAKRFLIPHMQMPTAGGLFGGLFSGYYVPSGRLYIVPRAPYFREWTTAGRGTNKSTDESFKCQSNDGLNITAEMVIAASVREENAAKFLYAFGVNPPQGDRSDPNIIFASVYTGKSLTEVMDGVVRGEISTLVCDQLSQHSLNDDNAQMYPIRKNIEKDVRSYLSTIGIDLVYVGWAGTWSFDKEIQEAINRNFASTQDQMVAKNLEPYSDTLVKLAEVSAIRDLSNKWNGALPSNLSGLWLLPTDVISGFNKIADTLNSVGVPAPVALPKK